MACEDVCGLCPGPRDCDMCMWSVYGSLNEDQKNRHVKKSVQVSGIAGVSVIFILFRLYTNVFFLSFIENLVIMLRVKHCGFSF